MNYISYINIYIVAVLLLAATDFLSDTMFPVDECSIQLIINKFIIWKY